jgi:hypothetical protein
VQALNCVGSARASPLARRQAGEGEEPVTGLLQAVVSGPMPAMLAELFPASVRCTASSISYNAAMTLWAAPDR